MHSTSATITDDIITAPDLHLFQAMAGAENGGAEMFFERLAQGFHQNGLRQTLAIKPWPGRVERLSTAGMAPQGCGFAPFPGFLDGARLKRMIRRSGADLVLTWMNRATRLTPRVRVPHIARLGGYYDLKYYRGCDWLVANTRGIADYLIREGWPAERVHIQVNFVPDGSARNTPSSSDEPVLVSLGRFHPNKGFDTLLRAFARVNTGRLRLAGDGPERAALIALADELGLGDRVEFPGWQDDPQGFIAGGDIFVCPSRHEPFGNVIMEAFACRMPVVTTASAGALENASDGEDALITPVDDAAALADALAALMQDQAQRDQLAKAGYATFRRGFTADRVIRGWFDFLAEVAG